MVTSKSPAVKIYPIPLAQKLDNQQPVFCRTANTTKALGVSRSWLYQEINAGKFIEDIHFIKPAKTKLWNLALCVDRLIHWDDELSHQRAIERFFESLPSNWPAKRGRKAG